MPALKVQVANKESWGWGDIIDHDNATDECTIRFYSSPVDWKDRKVLKSNLRRTPLAEQTRCYCYVDGIPLVGRVSLFIPSETDKRRYRIQFPDKLFLDLDETEFIVRSYTGVADPTRILQALFHETPFLFEHRQRFVSEYVRYRNGVTGLTGFSSSRIEVMPHQVEIVRRVLQDPTLRYLLADEVGLGKTIEAGTILRQIKLDYPNARICVFVPRHLKPQWQDELWRRFQLEDITVGTHEELQRENGEWDVLVIDEAHHITPGPGNDPERSRRFDHVRTLSHRIPHILLLSATPVLHHDRELLAMLNLLDKDSHPLDDLAGFREKMNHRQEIGRKLLALSKAKSQIFLRTHAKSLAELLPNDKEVNRMADQIISDSEAATRIATELQTHLTETYRIHRRLLKTRRASLLEQGLMFQFRDSPTAEFIEEDTEYEKLWTLLEEWRIEAAGRTLDVSLEETHRWVNTYIEMATALASDSSRFRKLVESRIQNCEEFEREHLDLLLQHTNAEQLESGRAEWLDEVLEYEENRVQSTRCVIFASCSMQCDTLYRRIRERSSDRDIGCLHAGMTDISREETLLAFQRGDFRFLIVDQEYEEGRNLEFVDSLLMVDLPWSVMRLEQRIGRLDRINRVAGDVRSQILLTTDDSNIAFDTAWYRVLKDGFGLFESSVSDLAFVIEEEMTQLAQIAFRQGPAGLSDEVTRIRQRVENEREQAAEQDVIDGLFVGELESTPTYKGLITADQGAPDFGSALLNYMKKSCRFPARVFKDDVQFPRLEQFPLIPADRLSDLLGCLAQRGTFRRQRAVRNEDVELYLPGHPLVESVWRIAQWDDRGRAFAVWRRLPKQHEPILVFRCCVRVELDLLEIHEQLGRSNWSELSKSNLLRMVGSWFPGKLDEWFLDLHGDMVNLDLEQLCKSPYDDGDINLGKHRSSWLTNLTGERAWSIHCEAAKESALKRTAQSESLTETQQKAIAACDTHFEMIRVRLTNRLSLRVEGKEAVQQEMASQDDLSKTIKQLVSKPRIWIDAIGLYVLSETVDAFADKGRS